MLRDLKSISRLLEIEFNCSDNHVPTHVFGPKIKAICANERSAEFHVALADAEKVLNQPEHGICGGPIAELDIRIRNLVDVYKKGIKYFYRIVLGLMPTL